MAKASGGCYTPIFYISHLLYLKFCQLIPASFSREYFLKAFVFNHILLPFLWHVTEYFPHFQLSSLVKVAFCFVLLP